MLRRIFDIVPVNIRDTPSVGAFFGDSSPLIFLFASGDLFVPTFLGFRPLFLLSLEFFLSLLHCHRDVFRRDAARLRFGVGAFLRLIDFGSSCGISPNPTNL